MTKYFFFILGLAFFWSCNDSKSHDPDVLTYWSSNNGGEIAFAKWAVEKWNDEGNKAIKYQPIPEGQTSEEILLAAVVAGTTPDIYSNIWQGAVEFYRVSNILVALDTLDGFMEFLASRCDSATIEEITAPNGHIYQFPWKINPIMTIYNKGLFDGLGLSAPPAKYSDYLDAAERFKKDTDGDGYVDQWFGNTSVKLAWHQRLFNFYPLYLASSGGMPLIKDGRAFFNNEHGIGAFRFLQTMYKNNYFSKQAQAAGQDLFVAQRYATKFTGPWEIQYLERFKQDGFQYDFYQIPVPDDHQGPAYTYCDPKNMVIFNTCSNPQMAFEFIKSMTTEESDLKFLETTNQLPRRKNMEEIQGFQDFFERNPKMVSFVKQAKYIRGVGNSEVMTEILDLISQEYEACVLYQMKTPEQAMADAERAVNVLLRAES
ncbi:extracellular solute-binding protein [Portibacter lacus]|uniref:Sugar ABC transporter substrate-binding protein n=1 Tax=Portibacter lacus TaxID=1099794 RepID=A0AA37SPL8_9BACT|nr:extracellular solute-binding protein [Portibacter lacus]GLR17137.1 sugar ABC transporter substrate-binding protein [Portibacter lacus]